MVDVVVRARDCLVALGIRDESATLAAIAAVDDSTLAGLRVVLVVTDTFHPAQLSFLRRLAAQPSCRTGSAVPAAPDTALLDQLRQLGCDDAPQLPAPAQPRVIACPDPDEEVRHTIRQCAGLIDGGVPADDIAIVCAAPTYPRPR